MMDDFSVGPFCRIFILACATACCCVLSPKTLAGELGKAALSEKPIEVLGGRLTVRMPQGAKIEAALRFLDQGGEQAVITSPDLLAATLTGAGARSGTRIERTRANWGQSR